MGGGGGGKENHGIFGKIIRWPGRGSNRMRYRFSQTLSRLDIQGQSPSTQKQLHTGHVFITTT